MKSRKLLVFSLVTLLLAMPLIIRTRYFLHVLILAGLYVVLALSYDLSVGHVGDLSLGHPAFFGIGAYVAGILSHNFGSPFFLNVVTAVMLAVVVAFVIGYPSFKLPPHAFAMATMGFAIVANSLAQNWTRLTGGPMCISQIARPEFRVGNLSWTAQSLNDFYYLILALAVLSILLVRLYVRSRVGRSFIAVREDAILSLARGINPTKYRLLAFCTGGAIASVAGVFYAHYTTVVCPTEFSFYYTVNLLFMVFIGGSGTINGVIAGAVVFTVLPEILRMTPMWRMVIYGIILIFMIVRMPEGLQRLPPSLRGLWSSRRQRRVQE